MPARVGILDPRSKRRSEHKPPGPSSGPGRLPRGRAQPVLEPCTATATSRCLRLQSPQAPLGAVPRAGQRVRRASAETEGAGGGQRVDTVDRSP